jgi:CHAD domain-containing protein
MGAKTVSHATTPVSARLAARVVREAGVLVREARRAHAGKARGVHQARVSSRRLREMLAIAAPAAGGDARSLARDARRIGRVLGPLREIDVSSAVWREPQFEGPWAPTLLTRLDRAAEADRARLTPAMRATIERLAGPDLQRRAQAMASALVAAAPDRQLRLALTRSVRARSRALERALKAAGLVYAPELLHQVRIAAKKFRYALELVRDLSDLPMAGPLRRLKVQQDLLGRLHDLQVVQARLERISTEGGVSRTMLRAIKAAETDLERECRALHGRFVAGLAALADLSARARAAVELERVQPRPRRMSADQARTRRHVPAAAAAGGPDR